MGCLTQSEVTELQAKADRIAGQLALLYTAFDNALGLADIEEYRFDSGDGTQRTLRRDPGTLEKMIRGLESRYEWYVNKIRGKGITNMNLRRDKAGRYLFS